jgi:oligopeptide/dipeptide ABC transporter ATP-binding protein
LKDQNLLEIHNLTVQFPSGDKFVKAVNGVNLGIRAGETLGIVGESGCGKSVSLFSILRLLPPQARIDGEIFFDGKELLHLPINEMRRIRGKEISMIFQEPMTSLNPVLKIGEQLIEAITFHEKVRRKEAAAKSLDLLRLVEIPDTEKRLNSYPHQLSGGMRQRVMIAMALACKPKILLADEPTTALDVTIQAQILDLMQRLKEEYGMSIVIVTHDMGVIAEIAQRVAVFYAGRVVEEAETVSLFDHPTHPYTEGLLGCIPLINVNEEHLNVIEGMIPNPLSLPAGCPFHPRCHYATDICRTEEPHLMPVSDNHKAACHLAAHRFKAGT